MDSSHNAGTIVGDDITTQQYLREGCHESGNPMLYGKYPQQPRFLAVSFGLAAGQIAAARLMVRSRHAWMRDLGYAVVTAGIADRSEAIEHNLALNCSH